MPLSGPSILRFNVTAGTTYYIAVDSMPGKAYSQLGTTSGWLSQVGQGLIALNWALRPSGVLRFATEVYDIDGWKFNGILNPGSSPMPLPLYQCTETESFPGGGGYSGNEAVHNTYYTYDPAGVLVTVTRVGGACGRLLVDYTTADIITDTNMFSFGPIPAVAEEDYTPSPAPWCSTILK